MSFRVTSTDECVTGASTPVGTFFAARARDDLVAGGEAHPVSESVKIAVVEDDERMRRAMVFQLGTAACECPHFLQRRNSSRRLMRENLTASWPTFFCRG